MSSPSSVDGAVSPSVDEHEDMDAEEHLDSSSSHVHDSSKEGEIDDQSTTKPKRNRKSTQRLLDSFTDEDFAFAHKHKKKKSHKKMDSSSDAHNESGGEASNDHEPEQVKEGRAKVPPRVVPGKLHLQCTFMESKKKSGTQCKQRVIDGYLFCIWHIMNDKNAPYKKCAHMRDKEKNGVKSRVQCKTAIRDTTDPPFCLAHSSDRRKKPSKKKREPSHAPSTSKGGSSETASPLVAGSLAPSSRSSSIFNLRNEEFAQDIEEAIGNMDAGLNLMDTFDDFESLDDEDEVKEEDEDTVGGGSTVVPPLPFEMDDELDEHERRLMDDIVVPVYAVGVKIIARLAKMRKNYNAGAAFWSACGTHPEVPTTIEEYNQKYIRDTRFDGMQISQARKDEIKGLINDQSSPIGTELAMLHKFNTDMLREQHSLQRSVLNNLPG